MKMKRMLFVLIIAGVSPLCVALGNPGVLKDPQLDHSQSEIKGNFQSVSRTEYHEKLQGFWLGQCIANWTGLRTEMGRTKAPFYTDKDWGTMNGRKHWETKRPQMIEYVLVEKGDVWGADDDTDIEYIYQDALEVNETSVLTPAQIRTAWLTHIKAEEQNYLWVSNQRALDLMLDGMLPPETSNPDNNKDFNMIDAQLTTEIFGLFAPGRPDVALKMSHMPIRTTAFRDAEWISEFYVIMHSLASRVNTSLSLKDQVFWLAEQARKHLPENSYPAGMYDFIRKEYENNPDKDNWELTRDRFDRRHRDVATDGYKYNRPADAGINFGASLISLFYGEGDYRRTIQIGSLCGWDSDNPTATWGGLLGFMLGRQGVQAAFPDKDLSNLYHIGRTRINFPDRTPDLPGDDTFADMAERGIRIIDRVVTEEAGGRVDLKKDVWLIPLKRKK
jgi:hypothetical protein